MNGSDRPDPVKELVELDKIVHEPRRFGILNALNEAGNLGSIYLRRVTGLSQGNLATHLRKLEDAGLVEIRKHTILRRPYLRVHITDAGRKALTSHWRRLKDLEREMKGWRPSDDPEVDFSGEEYTSLSRGRRGNEENSEAGKEAAEEHAPPQSQDG